MDRQPDIPTDKQKQFRQANKDASPFLCCFVVVVAVVVVDIAIMVVVVILVVIMNHQ